MEEHDVKPYEIEQEFEEGATVWWLECNSAKRGKVVEATETDGGYEYAVEDENGDMVMLDNFEIFPVAEALARSIFEDFDPDDIDLDLQK